MKTIMAAITGGGGASVAQGGELVAQGGEVPKAAPGGLVRGGFLGRDSVGALLMPGEVVLPSRLRGDFQAISDFARSMMSGGTPRGGEQGMGGRDFQGYFQISRVRDQQETANLIDAINTAVKSQGFTLFASHIVS
jgi:hypothetical protein